MEPDPLGQPARDQGDVRAAAGLPLPVPRLRARRRALSEPPALGRGFGNVARTYDRVRPPYFAPLLDRVQDALGLAADSRVLDLGAGTGRLTRELVRRFETVTAVEPDDEMRAMIDVGRVLAGSAEAIPLEKKSVDCVFVGDAHWFDTRRAVAEIARVLVPHGALAIVWMHWWEPEPPLPVEAVDLLREPYDRFAEQRPEPWEDAFDDSPFEPLEQAEFMEEVTVDPDLLLAMYSTTSSYAVLPDDERTALFARVRPFLSGTYRLPIKHELTWTRLRR